MPKVNGSLLQGQLKRKKHLHDNDSSRPAKRMKTDSWKDTSNLGTREEFIDSLTNIEHSIVLQQFNSIVFGIVSLFKGQLMGGKKAVGSEYNARTREEFCHGVKGPPMNFRTWLLSCFKPHGGKPVADESLYDQYVFYVEIGRESAADILTVRRFLNLVKEQLRPGQHGCPRYIVIGGDQPSYKMIVDLLLESWRLHNSQRHSRHQGKADVYSEGSQLHEWFIPFPGFFHAEKQAMYSLCKEMLDGLGLEELAECAGLSQSHVTSFIKHSHARNNRAVLFNLACAMIIHLIDLVLLEDASLSAQVTREHTTHNEKVVSADNPLSTAPPEHLYGGENQKSGSIHRTTSHLVSDDVMRIREKLRDRVRSRFVIVPNGKHFVYTVLFTCLLPTVRFHVLSRTGHTDFVHAFWYKHNPILHFSTHLKYQELSVFFAFFRGILPTVFFFFFMGTHYLITALW